MPEEHITSRRAARMNSSLHFDSNDELPVDNYITYGDPRRRLEEGRKERKVPAVAIIFTVIVLFAFIAMYLYTGSNPHFQETADVPNFTTTSSLSSLVNRKRSKGKVILSGLMGFAGIGAAVGTYVAKNTWPHGGKINSTFGEISGSLICGIAIVTAIVGYVTMGILGLKVFSDDIQSILGKLDLDAERYLRSTQ